MNDDDLEQRLRGLQPAEPPRALLRELLAAEPGKIHWLKFALPFAAAAAIALGFLIRPDRDSTGHPAPALAAALSPSDFRVFIPIERTSTLLEVRDVAVIDREPTRPVRVVRATWLDDVIYAGDDGRSQFRRQEPRSEIIPVALETF